MKRALIFYKEKQVTFLDSRIRLSLLDSITVNNRLVIIYTGYRELGTQFEVFASFYDPQTQCLSEIPMHYQQEIIDAIQVAPSKELNAISSHGIEISFLEVPDTYKSVMYFRKPVLLKLLICAASIVLNVLYTLADIYLFKFHVPFPVGYYLILGCNISMLYYLQYPMLQLDWCFTRAPFSNILYDHVPILIEPLCVLLAFRLVFD